MRSNLDIQQGTGRHSEGKLAKAIERQTVKVPSDLFLWAAFGAIAVGFFLEVTGHEEKGHWVGQWVAPILLLGLYNKLVKVSGSEGTSELSTYP